jgi:DNA-binding MarR family transcriptional regulator
MDVREESQREGVTEQIVDDTLGLLQAMHAVATPLLCQLDVTMSQVKTMLTVAMKGEVTIGFIAHAMVTGLPAASTTVDRLVNLGWVSRSEDPVDRRRAIVTLTATGRDVIETVWRLRRGLLRDWLGRMDEEDLTVLAQGVSALKSVSMQDDLDPATAG